MRDPIPVFINLVRLRDLSTDAFNWVVDSLGIDVDPTDEADLQEVAGLLEADIIRYGRKIVLRDRDGDPYIWDPDSDEWTVEDDRLIALIARYPRNPLRDHQEGYDEFIKRWCLDNGAIDKE